MALCIGRMKYKMSTIHFFFHHYCYVITHSCIFHFVLIQDTENPVITGMPSNIQQNTDAQLTTATVTWTPPTASDNSRGNVVLTSSHNPGHVFDIGTFTVTYTATDPYSNVATVSFTVTVKGQ